MARVQDDTARVLVTRPTERHAWDGLLAEVPTADALQSWAWSEAGIATGERWVRLLARRRWTTRAALQWQLVSPVLGHPLAYAPHGPVWRAATMHGAVRSSALTAMRDRRAARARRRSWSIRGGHPRPGGCRPVVRVRGLGFEATSRHVQMPSTRVLDLRDGWRPPVRPGTRTPGTSSGVPRARGSRSSPSAPTTARRRGAARADAGRRVAWQLRAPLGAFLARTVGRRPPGVHLSRPVAGRVIAGALVGLVGHRAYYQFAGSLREPELRHANAAYGVMDRVIAECVDARSAQSRSVRRQREG